MLTFPNIESADIIEVREAHVTGNPFKIDVPLLKSFFPSTKWEEDNGLLYWVIKFLAGSPASSLHWILNNSVPKSHEKIHIRLYDPSSTLQQQASQQEKMTVLELRRDNMEDLFALVCEDYQEAFGEKWTPSSVGNPPATMVGFDPNWLENMKKVA